MLAYSMTDDPIQSKDNPAPRRLRRATRYQKAQQRKAEQYGSDNRLYGAMFAMMSVFALLAILIGAIMMNGGNVDTSGMAGLAQPWLGPFTMLEVLGVAFVALIAGMTYLRMRKR